MAKETNETGGKVDYYSILKRRKRTVNNFLADFNIKSQEELQYALVELAGIYSVSDEFKDLCIRALPTVKTVPIEEPIVELVPEEPVIEIGATNINEEINDLASLINGMPNEIKDGPYGETYKKRLKDLKNIEQETLKPRKRSKKEE
jgi:hypothetical protein